jgi:predicted molibdopterin-dependent oxidoreductase YjgC
MRNPRIEKLAPGAPLTVMVNGRPIQVRAGETVHAALVTGGFLALRKSRLLGDPRGAFCGMGACYECLVTINAVPHQRACMRLVEPGMEIWIDADNL